jgi:hypothetical protein
MDDTKARVFFGLTALVVLAGIVVQVIVTANGPPLFFQSSTSRGLNVFAFFTILSNVIVGGTTLLLAMNPRRSSTLFDTFRLTGVVAITITGIVYHSVLAGLLDLDSWALVADHALHTVVPVLAVLGWLMFGPRGLTSARIAKLSAIFPVLWMIFTVIRGAIVGFYPYPFVDVEHLGYAKVTINSVWIAGLYLGLAYSAKALDGWLARTTSRTSADVAP